MAGVAAKVRAITDDGQTLHVEFRNGVYSVLARDSPYDFSIGSVVYINSDTKTVSQAPDEAWVEQLLVGVVRKKLPAVTLIEVGSQIVSVPTRTDVDYSEQNTVEFSSSGGGVIQVLIETPVRVLDIPEINNSTIEDFILKSDGNKRSFDDFGGLKEVVARTRELIETPLKQHQEMARMGARPIKGVLFTGNPGTGKTFLARIIADAVDAKFYEISGPAIFSKWYGQSEEVLRRLFDHAREQERAIIFFDEIDSVAAQRGDDVHEVSRRVVAQLLTLMDGIRGTSNVVVIAATNRPQDIDVALLRPGRFDWQIVFRLPNLTDRDEILRLSSTGLQTRGELDHSGIARLTDGWSSAELALIWNEAALLALKDGRSSVTDEDYFGGYRRVAEQRSNKSQPSKGVKIS